jgi:hypothetical protein
MEQQDHLAFAVDFVIEPEAIYLFKRHVVLLEFFCVLLSWNRPFLWSFFRPAAILYHKRDALRHQDYAGRWEAVERFFTRFFTWNRFPFMQ